MKDILLKFFIKEGKTSIKSENKLDVTAQNGEISCSIYYDYSPVPLTLKGRVQPGDEVKLILMSFRVELWINNELWDEEWPAGQRLYSPEEAPESNTDVFLEDFSPGEYCPPSVLGSFRKGSGWRPGKGVFVGDCMPYVDSGRYHVLYLKDRHHHSSKWGLGAHQWEHISTADFDTWDIHPMAVEITDSREGSICTGSHIRKDGMHYLFYTVRMCDKSPAPICRSISEDGYHFRKDTDFSFSLPEKYDTVSARDPKIIEDGEGMYHMFLTSRLTAENKGCLVHLVSRDLDRWTPLENPIYISSDDTEPECPDYIVYGGYYYLIYSLHGKAYYLYSRNPFDGWQVPADPLVPCSSVPKGALWNGKIVFTGFERINDYAGTLTFKAATNSDSGELVFE